MTVKTKKKLKPSKSYLKFEKTIHRSLNLISLQVLLSKIVERESEQKELDISDLSRAAVVFAVAGMDAYFTDVFAEHFIPYLKKKGPNERIVSLLEKAGLNAEVSLELLSMQRPYRRIRALIEGYLEKQTMQKTKIVDELFLAYNLKDFSHHVSKLKKRRTLLRSIEILVERRHEIAHEGDMNSFRKTNPIDEREVRRRIQDIVNYVAGADEILQKRCG